MTANLHESARYYANNGFHIFPCVEGGKKPLTSNGFKAASTASSEIDAWWQQWPDANIGIATGASGLVVIDVDSGKPGCEWDELVARLGKLPETPTARTPSGGYHYYFEAHEGVEVKSNAGKLAAGVDIRAHGGYVIAPPSEGEIVDSTYQWINNTTTLASLPQAWLDAILEAQSNKRQSTAPDWAKPGRFPMDATTQALLASTSLPPMPETPENVAKVKAMLAYIPADCGYENWRNICWAVMATGWACAEDLARDWSQSAPEKYDAADFQKVVASFQPGAGIGFGTLVHHARQHGYTALPDGQRADSDGGLPERLIDSYGDILNGRVFAKIWKNKYIYVASAGKWLAWREN